MSYQWNVSGNSMEISGKFHWEFHLETALMCTSSRASFEGTKGICPPLQNLVPSFRIYKLNLHCCPPKIFYNFCCPPLTRRDDSKSLHVGSAAPPVNIMITPPNEPHPLSPTPNLFSNLNIHSTVNANRELGSLKQGNGPTFLQ